ncbi:SusD/RagB family nutrient-binding outer membrane lipoprotein [Mucilaginibacter sp.]|jgi:hypothetical protein|uniref:SusD/RagB family nutrient-binding outer membrane lipoprotein n=1 Tax=Mucilaginibacter sp. TaxID=1882438 RepID=UPI003562FB0A
MKRLFNILMVCGLVVTATSCKKYLDVNTNPNAPISSTPDLILPQAIVSTASYSSQFNSYGAYTDGQIANAGGYGAFGSQTTYNFATTDYTNLFQNSYDNINDYQYVVNNSTTDGNDRYYNAAARIMRAFAYQRLVDTYGDVPYTEAVQGAANTTPKYDKAEDIYTDLFAQLNTAIASIDNATAGVTSINQGPSGKVDVLFSGDMTKWKAFANTIKLRMLIRVQAVPALASVFATEKAKLAGATFLSDDAIVQPGYVGGQDGKQNPQWNTFAYTFSGTAAGSGLSQEPTAYAVGFYDSKKISDPNRGAVVYKSLTASTGQLGSSNNPVSPNGSGWFSGTGSGTAAVGVGVLKGPAMGHPIMLAAESYFLQAEANTIGLVGSLANAQGATGNFNKGIEASFKYLYKDQAGGYSFVSAGGKAYTSAQATADAAAYIASNVGGLGNDLVVFDGLTTQPKRLEAIITQKWIALNFIHGDECYNEYRRTGYPRTVPNGTAVTNAASTLSASTAADKLPTRIQYPSSEYSLNSANVPAAVNNFTSKIFWDIN